MAQHQLERWALVITVEAIYSVDFGICLKFSIIRHQEEEDEREKGGKEGRREGVDSINIPVEPMSHGHPWIFLQTSTGEPGPH